VAATGAAQPGRRGGGLRAAAPAANRRGGAEHSSGSAASCSVTPRQGSHTSGLASGHEGALARDDMFPGGPREGSFSSHAAGLGGGALGSARFFASRSRLALGEDN
jgi:hypothetical protein